MAADDKFQLYVFEGDYGLVSLEPECIQSILYTKIAGVPAEVRHLSNFKYCVKYSAPSLVNGKLVSTNFDKMVTYFRTKNYNIDHFLSAKQCSEMYALISLVNAKLRPILDYVYWVDVRNTEDFTFMWYIKALPLPFNYTYPRKEKNKASDLMDALYPMDTNLDIIKGYLLSSATQSLTAISARLGTLDFMFGSSPTTLDIVIYSYIAPLIKLPFPSNEFGNLFSLWPNLEAFVKRMDAKYMPNTPIGPKYLKKEDKTKTANDDDISYTAVAIITLSAFSLLFGFAASRGLIQSQHL